MQSLIDDLKARDGLFGGLCLLLAWQEDDKEHCARLQREIDAELGGKHAYLTSAWRESMPFWMSDDLRAKIKDPPSDTQVRLAVRIEWLQYLLSKELL